MRPLTDREKRTVRIGGIGLAIYLALFCGMQVWKFFERRRSDYRQLLAEAQQLRRDIQPYEDKAQILKKLMEESRLDPARLSRTTVVAEASAAIQKAAQSGGIQLGPVRESPTRASGKEIATVQLEGSGPAPAVLAFLHRINSLGYPLIVDTMQLNSDNSRPGPVKVNLTIIILDFDQWKPEAPHA